jgi:putative FmdB family regulatory protein
VTVTSSDDEGLMPIYEYRCGACRRRASLYFQTFSSAERAVPVCPHCGSEQLSRLVSLVALRKSEESRLDDLADPSSFGDIDENDPRSMARWARKMGDQLGEDLGDDFDQMVEQMEAGEMPDRDGGLGDYGF